MKPKIPKYPRNGFALVVTISMMVLLTILVVATLSLSSITLRSVDRDAAKAVARANAQLALTLAIGQLQKQAGPDQRVTGTGSLGVASGESLNPSWTGVWDSVNKTAPPVWLVSGDNPDPVATSLDTKNSVLFSSVPSGDANRKEIRAPYVEVEGKVLKGRYAYWVSDEGTKARVDIGKPTSAPTGQGPEYLTRQLAPQAPGIYNVDPSSFAAFKGSGGSSTFDTKRASIASMNTLTLVADGGTVAKEEIPNYYLNDLTTGGYGLPVNVKDGGMKADLSVLFDSSQDGKTAMQGRYFGAKMTPYTYEGSPTYETIKGISNGSKFFLSSKINKGGLLPVGPNWGNIYSYAKLWKNVQSNSMTMVGAYPRPESDLRQENWMPYRNSNVSSAAESFDQDPQHGNSAVTPVLAFAQLTFRVKVISQGTGTVDSPPVGKYFVPAVEIKPVVGIWNPYNVAIKNASYLINWAVAPYMRVSTDDGNDGITEIWLREYWKTAEGTLPSDSNKQGGAYFNLTTPSVNLQPGEIRLFSINTPQPLATSGNSNVMVASWGEAGGFYMPIKRSRDHSDGKQKKGNELRVKTGKQISFGSCSLQDTQMETPAVIKWDPSTGTAAHFAPTKLSASASATWLTLKSGGMHLNRYTNFWNGGINERMGTPMNSSTAYFMPEQIGRGDEASTDARRSYLIDALARGDVGHLVSWRFLMRNGTEGQKSIKSAQPTQGIRNWMDTNARPLASNLRFDGSKTGAGTTQGWNMVSNWIADSNEYNNLMGDRKGGNRGLVAEGSLGEIEPSAKLVSGRYQGFGGASSREGGAGVGNVMIFDVPRGPLFSLGQLQHAQLSRYNNEPSFVVGNSYANPRIPLQQTNVTDFAAVSGLEVVDISYEVNNRLWDSSFFSTLAPDYLGKTGSFDNAFDFQKLTSGVTHLPNSRMLFSPLPGDKSIDRILTEAGERGPEALAARIRIEGAFNVNSLSKAAWKAVFSTMENAELPVMTLTAAPTLSWEKTEGIRFNRFSHVGSKNPYTGSETDGNGFWNGWRKLSAEELDLLATEMVKEVKERGPFRTMADFVNRNPSSSTVEHQKKGALQAALDRVANKVISDDIALLANRPKGSQYSEAIDTTLDRSAAGSSSYLLQGDVLQSLAPVLQVRSDYFRIRTCGEALDPNGKVIARAYCEAYVQRIPEYVDTEDKPQIPFSELTSQRNKEFGRKFQLVSFRWLSPSEI